MLNVEAQYGINTMEVTQGVETVLDGLRPGLAQQGVQVDATLFRPANFIQTALKNIRSSLIIGAILVIVVLFLFLFNFPDRGHLLYGHPSLSARSRNADGTVGFHTEHHDLGRSGHCHR